MQKTLLWLPCLIFAIVSLIVVKPARSSPYPQSSGFGLDPLVLLNLIESLSRSNDSSPEQIDLSPDIAEIRGQISRLYFLLARQYAAQEQLPASCMALEKAYSGEFEAFLHKRLRSRQPASNDCFASEMDRISKITGSPTALIYVTTSKSGLELIAIPPNHSRISLFSRTRVGTKSLQEKLGIPLVDLPETNSAPVRKFAATTTTKEVDSVIINLRNNLQDASSYDFLPQSQQLYDLILRPVESELEKSQTKTIIFVMNGNLRVIPPAVLHDGKRYLIEKYAVASIPSWQLTEPSRPDRSLRPQILAMGLSESVEGLSPLPATEVEIATISSQVLVGQNFLNNAFTKDNLRLQTDRQKFGIIHLATHAKFLNESPEKSYIQFWDGRLQMNQISAMNLVPDLLTLSACETAVGQHLGLAGLAIDSGAKSVMASLWEVSDVGTVPLMIRFYSGLSTAPSKAIALQESQLALLRGEVTIEDNQIKGIKKFPRIPFLVNPKGVKPKAIDLKHPYFWSSFTLIGNWL
jgi:CHAT domain-containing protein